MLREVDRKGERNWLCMITACFILLAAPNAIHSQANEVFTLDHIVLFSSDSALEYALQDNLLTIGEKLTTEHPEQGTAGQFFLFHNTFIELLYLRDDSVARANEQRFGSSYTSRWDRTPASCPIGIGLCMEPFDTTWSDPAMHVYRNPGRMPEDFYLMSVHNVNARQPLVYISTPQHCYRKMDSIAQVDEIYDEQVRDDFRAYLSHPSGIQKLTKLLITLPTTISMGNVALLKYIQGVELTEGDGYSLVLEFDHGAQRKEVNIDGDVPIKVRY